MAALATVPIDDTDELYRRVALNLIRRDGTLSKGAFMSNKKPDHSISVELGRLTNPDDCLQRARIPENNGVAALVAKVPRIQGFEVRHDPTPDTYAHSLIEGESTKTKCRILADACRIILPDDRAM